jgi:hypothetical protein
MTIGTRVIGLLVALATLGLAAPAPADPVCTAVTTLPFLITTQGVYCFTNDLTTNIATGNAIEIRTNNVTLDLNGYKLGGLAGGPATQAIGILAEDRQNITIRNGTIRGFYFGILLKDLGASRAHLVESIRADQNTGYAISVEGLASIVRRNLVTSTGGSTFFGPDADAFGISVFGDGLRVIDNDVSNTFATGAGVSTAIWIRNSTGGLAVRNRMTTANIGIDYDSSTGKYRGNLTSNVTTAFQGGGTDAGDNN